MASAHLSTKRIQSADAAASEGEKPFKPSNALIIFREAREMAEIEKDTAAKPRSDWDGYIIPQEQKLRTSK